jgi:hypothetical protein
MLTSIEYQHFKVIHIKYNPLILVARLGFVIHKNCPNCIIYGNRTLLKTHSCNYANNKINEIVLKIKY